MTTNVYHSQRVKVPRTGYFNKSVQDVDEMNVEYIKGIHQMFCRNQLTRKPKHWKEPFVAKVPKELCPWLRDACIWFCGDDPEFYDEDEKHLVCVCRGYQH